MSDYWAIDSFLADAQRLPCTFLNDCPNLGHLEGTGERDMRKGTTVELPFWLGLDLAQVADRCVLVPCYYLLLGERIVAKLKDLLSLALPKPYASRVRNALSASSQSVSLKALNGGAFFPAGVRLGNTIQDEKLKEAMYNAFRDRLAEVFDQSQHMGAPGSAATDAQAADFVAGLDDWERELFASGEASARAMRVWSEERKRA